MSQNKENLEGIVSKLKKQGVDAGEEEKQRIIENAKAQAEQIISEAKAKSKTIVVEAEVKAAQAQKNSQTAIAQASRDMVEATKIAVLKYLKSVFGRECKTLFTQEEYLRELLRAVLASVSGNKSVKVAPEMLKDMEAFILAEALKEEVTLIPLSSSKTKIKVKCTDKVGVDFVLSSKDIETGLFALLNKDLVERITLARGV
jgi:V/A-type H+-transporting ATPase subunit E